MAPKKKTETAKPTKLGRGRPFAQIDKRLVMRLARIGCTTAEIAQVLEVCSDTIERRCMPEIEKGRSERRMSLRHKQYQKALKGDTALLIWLGKQDLGQKDKSELTGADDGPLQIHIVERFAEKQ